MLKEGTPSNRTSRRRFVQTTLTGAAAITAGAHLATGRDLPNARAEQPAADADLPHACIDGNGPGWVELGDGDLVNVNCAEDTWKWKDGVLYCTGKPTGVARTVKRYTNFELVCLWNHRRHAGNSGIFVWTTDASLEQLAAAGKPGLPKGIEVQVLDPGYEENWEKSHNGQPSDWFTSHGDVFPVGVKMKPFPPLSANGSRSFPTKRLVKPHGQWNHYYIRALNGEVRLWVNGEEVSGGNDCDPREGHLCLESEGAPIEFKHLRIRELP